MIEQISLRHDAILYVSQIRAVVKAVAESRRSTGDTVSSSRRGTGGAPPAGGGSQRASSTGARSSATGGGGYGIMRRKDAPAGQQGLLGQAARRAGALAEAGSSGGGGGVGFTTVPGVQLGRKGGRTASNNAAGLRGNFLGFEPPSMMPDENDPTNDFEAVGRISI